MPDFADKRIKQKAAIRKTVFAKRSERDIPAGVGAPPSAKRGESPLSQFVKLIHDFRGGIKDLRNIAGSMGTRGEGTRAGKTTVWTEVIGQSGKSPPTANAVPPDIRVPSPVEISSRNANQGRVSHFSRTGTSARPTIRDKNIRIPHMQAVPHRNPVVLTKLGSLDRHPGFTGADREAQKHIYESRLDPQSPASLPSAARLAQILQADRLMRSGELEAHPQIQAWAESVREGRRREVADIEPEVVHNTLVAAAGGVSQAQQLLSTPAVQQIVERHTIALQTHRSELRELERRLESGKPSAERKPISLHESSRVPHAGLAFPRQGAVANRLGSTTSLLSSPEQHDRLQGSASTSIPHERLRPMSSELEQHDHEKMQHMLASNEEPHLAQVTGTERERLQREIRGMTVPETRSSSSDRRMVASPSESTQRTAPIAHAAVQAERGTASQITAATFKNMPAVQAQQQSRVPGNDRKEIQGKLKLINNAGAEIGVAELNAEF